MADDRTYIRLHDGMPDHPKIDVLSDKAFRLLITTWCWCSRHLTDGHIPAAVWTKRGTPAARAELLTAGLVEQAPGGAFQMHDYLEHQRSADEVAAMRAKRAEAGRKGAESRWGMASVMANAKQMPSQMHGKAMASTETEADTTSNEVVGTRTKRGHQIPNDWAPSEQHRLFAAEQRIDLTHEAAQFTDHHLARGSSMKDWDRAFWTWLRNCVKWRKDPPSSPASARLPHARDLEIPPDGLSPEEYAAWHREARARRAQL